MPAASIRETQGLPDAGATWKLAKVASAAAAQAGSFVSWANRTNRVSAIPWAIPLYQGARIISVGLPCSAKSNG